MDLDSLGFMLKKAVSAFLMPSGIIFILLASGLFIWPLKRRRVLARNAFFLAFLLYAAGSTGPVSNLLLMALEGSPRAFVIHPETREIVVLCGGLIPDERLPLEDRLTSETRMRILTGVHLARTVPGIESLIVTGNTKVKDGGRVFSEAGIAADWIRGLGLAPPCGMLLVEDTRDTDENLAAVKRLLGETPFYLVTSALHMPRALMIAERNGLHAQPVPCDFRASTPSWSPADLWPDPSRLDHTDSALHEYVGMAWQLSKNMLARLENLL